MWGVIHSIPPVLPVLVSERGNVAAAARADHETVVHLQRLARGRPIIPREVDGGQSVHSCTFGTHVPCLHARDTLTPAPFTAQNEVIYDIGQPVKYVYFPVSGNVGLSFLPRTHWAGETVNAFDEASTDGYGRAPASTVLAALTMGLSA